MLRIQSRPKGAAPSAQSRLGFPWGSESLRNPLILLKQPESYSTTTLQIYSGHIIVNIVSLKRTYFVFSKMIVNMLSSRCSCMHPCSQGPHLWPFISSQVKGLRDNETHWHKMLVWNSSMWQPAVQSASSTGNVKHSSFKKINFCPWYMLKCWSICVMHDCH